MLTRYSYEFKGKKPTRVTVVNCEGKAARTPSTKNHYFTKSSQRWVDQCYSFASEHLSSFPIPSRIAIIELINWFAKKPQNKSLFYVAFNETPHNFTQFLVFNPLMFTNEQKCQFLKITFSPDGDYALQLHNYFRGINIARPVIPPLDEIGVEIEKYIKINAMVDYELWRDEWERKGSPDVKALDYNAPI